MRLPTGTDGREGTSLAEVEVMARNLGGVRIVQGIDAAPYALHRVTDQDTLERALTSDMKQPILAHR
uniref:Uncharacterized protein n=1 Tax=Streptomyces sp. NBC_00093 TaxID=2975649 RepID=A0AAU2AED1_9ACTN